MSKSHTGLIIGPASDERKRKASESQKGIPRPYARLNPQVFKKGDEILIARRAKQIFPVKDTKIEIALQKALTTLGISFRTHEPIIGQPDIFIEPNICVFADGDYWHSISKALKRDALVNQKLQEMGMKVLRFWGKDIENRLNWCIKQIEDNL